MASFMLGAMASGFAQGASAGLGKFLEAEEKERLQKALLDANEAMQIRAENRKLETAKTLRETEGTPENQAMTLNKFKIGAAEREQGLINLKTKGFRENDDGTMDVYDSATGDVYQTDAEGNAVGYRNIREMEGTSVQDIKKQDLELQRAELQLKQARQSLADSGIAKADKAKADKLLADYATALGEARRESDPAKLKEKNIILDQLAVNLSRYGIKVGGGLWPEATKKVSTFDPVTGETRVVTTEVGDAKPAPAGSLAEIAAKTKGGAPAAAGAPAAPPASAAQPTNKYNVVSKAGDGYNVQINGGKIEYMTWEQMRKLGIPASQLPR